MGVCTRVRRTGTIASFALLALSLVVSSRCAAQAAVGSSLEATADPTVPRPHTKHCEVNLLTDVAFRRLQQQKFQLHAACGLPRPLG
jgi:hypothetical protein